MKFPQSIAEVALGVPITVRVVVTVKVVTLHVKLTWGIGFWKHGSRQEQLHSQLLLMLRCVVVDGGEQIGPVVTTEVGGAVVSDRLVVVA